MEEIIKELVEGAEEGDRQTVVAFLKSTIWTSAFGSKFAATGNVVSARDCATRAVALFKKECL